MDDILYDTVIIGAGPGGLSAAMMLGRARRKVLVLDDGTPRNRFTSHMHAVIGFDGATPDELLRQGRLQLAQYDVTFAVATVTAVDDLSNILLVRASSKSFRTRTLISAAGARDELADIDGLHDLWGKKVLHCPYCHGWEVRDQRLAVIATQSMGLFQAELLRQWSPNLTAFIADAGIIDDTVLRRIEARGTAVNPERVTAVSTREDGTVDILTEDGGMTTVDAIFTGSTLAARDTYLPEILRRSESGFLELDGDGRTSHEKMWAAGNAASPYGNVPMSMGNGSAVGGAVSLALIEMDTAVVMQQIHENTGDTAPPSIACNYRK